MAQGGDCGAGGDAGEHEAQHQRQGADPRRDGRDARDGLEPHGEVEDERDHGAAEAQREAEPRRHAALLEDAGRERGGRGVQVLRGEEGGGEEGGEDEERDDPARAPGVGGAAPFEGQEQADDAGDQEEIAQGVELEEFLPEGGRRCGVRRELEDEDDDGHGEGADGEVYVEAPAPGRRLGGVAAAEGEEGGEHTI